MARLSKEIETKVYDMLGRDGINISYTSYGDIFENADPACSISDSNKNILMNFSMLTVLPGLVKYKLEFPTRRNVTCLVRINKDKHRKAAQRALQIKDAIIGKALQQNALAK